MVDRTPGRRSAARYLVPIALAATIASTAVIVMHALHSGRGSARVATRAHHSSHPPPRPPGGGTHVGPTSYIVRSGDTLGLIASKFGVSVAQIVQLNPNLNPNALQVGQRVRLRR
jgi:LysM repeat protein